MGRPDYLPKYDGCKTISPPEQNFWNGRGINYGVENAKGEYFFILNDDVVLTKDCIEPLLNKYSNTMPVSNDQQGRYSLPGLTWTNGVSEQILGDEQNAKIMMNTMSTPIVGQIFADTLCLYAHMVHRDIWQKVGGMDDDSGLIDIDWCLRVRQAGFMNAIELSSLVWHFGGSSVEHTLDGPKRIRQREQFKNKWGWVP